MKKPLFYISPEEYAWGTYEPSTNPQRIVVQSAHEVMPRANWFPGILPAIPIGQFNLFKLVAGSEKELLPNQRKLKEWITKQSQKHEPLKFPFFNEEIFAEEIFGELDEKSMLEDLCRRIMTHIETGSEEMFFLPTLPVNPHIKQDHKKESSWLFKLQRVPRIFPTALA